MMRGRYPVPMSCSTVGSERPTAQAGFGGGRGGADDLKR